MDILNVPVTLVIKTPSQKIADQTIECGLEWTIKRLKKHLSSVYPNKPEEHHQKLVYSGKLLQDDSVLKDVLRQHDDKESLHTLHLVCANDGQESPTSSSDLSKTSADTTTPVTEWPSLPNDGVRQRVTPSSSDTTTTTSTSSTNTSIPPLPQYGILPQQQPYNNVPYTNTQHYGTSMMHPTQQMAMMNYWYAQSMNQYMQMYQHSNHLPGSPSSLHSHSPNPAFVTPPVQTNPMQQQPHLHEAHLQQPILPPAAAGVPAPAVAAAQQDPPIAMNAQGGVADDADLDQQGGRRDWLDWLYVLSRFGFLLSILYFYSSFNQFLLVSVIILVVYAYQSGWFTWLPRRNNGQAQIQAMLRRRQQEAARRQRDGSDDSEDERDSEPATPVEPPAPGTLAVICMFFTTFFTSLIPQQPAPVNHN